MSKNIRTRPAGSCDADGAFEKAFEFAEVARSAFESEHWNAAGLNAIHAGICGADAVLIRAAGLKSISQNHESITDLLSEHVKSFKGSPRTQLVGLLKMKNTVAYEQRAITRNEAQRLVQAADRFLAWAHEAL